MGTTVHWRDLVRTGKNAKPVSPLAVAISKAASGETVEIDLHALRHLLVCGVADSGKTMLMHSILNSLIAQNGPEKLRLVIVDPKQVEYQPYDALLHLLTPVITDAKKTVLALKWLSKEAERRLAVLRKSKARSIAAYHDKTAASRGGGESREGMPYVVVVIDELALHLASFSREIKFSLAQLMPHARATGIHVIVTTTRFDTHSFPVDLREHFPARLVFHMPAAQSRLLLGNASAQALSERGAALFKPDALTAPSMLQTAHISDEEVDTHTERIARKYPKEVVPENLVPVDQYLREKTSLWSDFAHYDDDDDMYPQAVEAVREVGKASTSFLQRRLGIGYSRAAKLMDLLFERGIIGPADGSAPRKVIG